MGKKSSSSAPAIDPAVGQAMQQQVLLTQQQQNWYESEVYPWLKQQTQKQNEYSEADRAMALQNYQFWQNMATEQTERANAMSDEFYNRWKENYLPIENALLADAKNYNTSAEAERQAAYAIGDATTAYNAQKQALNQQLAQYGVNPTSGAYAAQNRAMDVNQAAVRAAAANQARSAARELGWNKQMQVAALGQQYIGNALNATNTGTSAAGTYGGLAGNSLGNANTYGQQGTANITNLANVGLNSYQSLQNAWGQYGQLGLSASNYNLNAWNAENQIKAQNNASMGGLIGAGVGAAATIGVAI